MGLQITLTEEGKPRLTLRLHDNNKPRADLAAATSRKRLVPLAFWESSNEMKRRCGFSLMQMEIWELKPGVPARYCSLRLQAAAPRASRHLMRDVSRRRTAPARGLRHAATSANPREHSGGSHSSNLSVLTSFRDKMSDLPEEGTPPHTHSAPPPSASAATPCESNYCN